MARKSSTRNGKWISRRLWPKVRPSLKSVRAMRPRCAARARKSIPPHRQAGDLPRLVRPQTRSARTAPPRNRTEERNVGASVPLVPLPHETTRYSMKRLPIVIAIAALCLSGSCREHNAGTGMQTTAEQEQAISRLRGAYAAFNRGDITAAVEPLDPQIEWIEPAEFPGGGTYHGQAGAKAYLTQSRESAAEVHSEPETFIPVGDPIVVFVHARVRAHDNDVWQ